MSKFSGKNLWVLVLAAVILAAALAQGRKSENVEIIAAFFEILGDILALLALQPGASSGESGDLGRSRRASRSSCG